MRMRNWTAAAAAMFTAALVLQAQEAEPSHNGKSLSQWIAGFKDKDWKVRLEAVDAVGQIGPPAKAAVPGLIVLARKNAVLPPALRRAAIEALAKIGADAKSAITELSSALRDEDTTLAEAAVAAIAKIGTAAKLKTAVTPLAAAVKENYKEHVETSKAEKQEKGGFPFGPRTQRKVVAEPGWKVRLAAINALVEFGSDAKPAIPALTDALFQSVVVHLPPTTQDPTTKAINPFLTRFSRRDRDRMMRDFGVGGGRNGNGEMWYVNRGDKSESYKSDATYVNTATAAADAIRKIDPAAATRILVGKLRSSVEYDRVRAAVALEWLAPDSKDAVPALADALRDASGNVREHVLYTLGGMGTFAKSATAVVTLLASKDADEDVRVAASSALEQLKVEKTLTEPAVVAKADPKKPEPKADPKEDPAKLEEQVREAAVAEFNKKIFVIREHIEKGEFDKAQAGITSVEEFVKSAADFLPNKGADQLKTIEDVKKELTSAKLRKDS
jgi:HEAT repeat protein